jgi:branched-chain amino acid transport system substrate-binding protein
MGEPEGKLFLFACNTYDQIAMLAMAMEKAKSTSPADFLGQFLPIANGPGQSVDNPVEGLQLIRSGKPINYTGAGSDVQFTPTGDLVSRDFGHYVIRGGKNQLVKLSS